MLIKLYYKYMKTSEQFINESKKIHDDKYNYSLVDYINNYTKVSVICQIHGIFKQTPNNHLRGQGCSKCSHIKINEFNTSNLNEFITKSNLKHKNKYDYSLVEYKNGRTKVVIICHIHGKFEQTPNAHRKGQGCHKCSNLNISKMRSEILNKDKFIKNCIEKHCNKYDYNKVDYINSKTKVTIICPIHGEFKQSPNNHQKGIGCSFCGIIKNRLKYIDKIKDRLKNKEQISPNFNNVACSFFDKISIENNIFIKHAMNGGEFYIKELGYWLDGYDEMNNTVYEWDEFRHFFKGKLREKDLIRQVEIEKFLKCKFIRIDGRNKK